MLEPGDALPDLESGDIVTLNSASTVVSTVAIADFAGSPIEVAFNMVVSTTPQLWLSGIRTRSIIFLESPEDRMPVFVIGTKDSFKISTVQPLLEDAVRLKESLQLPALVSENM